jgi:hypothetical protein
VCGCVCAAGTAPIRPMAGHAVSATLDELDHVPMFHRHCSPQSTVERIDCQRNLPLNSETRYSALPGRDSRTNAALWRWVAGRPGRRESESLDVTVQFREVETAGPRRVDVLNQALPRR